MSKNQNPDERIRPDYNALQKVPLTTPADDILVATGKTKEQWFAIFDSWGVASLKASELQSLIVEKLKMYPWWAEYFSKSYVAAHLVGKTKEVVPGFVSFGMVKQCSADLERLETAYGNPAYWPMETEFRVLKMKGEGVVQVAFEDNSRATVFFSKGQHSPSEVGVKHELIADPDHVPEHQKFWRELFKAIDARFGKW